MVKRAGAALLILGLSALAVFAGALMMTFVAMIVFATAAGEVYRSQRSPDVLPAASLGQASIAALLVVGYARAARAPAAFPFVVAASLFLSFVVMLLRRDRPNVTRALASTLLPVLTVGLPAGYVVALRSAHGGYTLAWVFLLMAFAAEAGAATATWFVRRRTLTPRVRRTWEHLSGAIVGALIAAVIAAVSASPPFTWPRALVLGVLVAVVVTIGDLAWATIEDDRARVEAGVKRQRAVVLPLVGGAVLSAPVFFYVFRAFVS